MPERHPPAGSNEMLDAFIKYNKKPDGFGAQAFLAGELFAGVVNDIVAADGLAQIGDEQAILSSVREVLVANQDAVAQIRNGKTGTFGFLVGQVMKKTGGKANPKLVNELLRRELDR